MDAVTTDLVSMNGIKDIDYSLLKDLSIEINFGLAMGFSSRNTKDPKPRKVVVKTCSPDGSYAFLEMESVSPKGVLGSLDTDVLNAIITIASEQHESKSSVRKQETSSGSLRIYFSLSDICRILGLDPRNMTSFVKESLEKLSSIDVSEKIFKHNASASKIYTEQVSYRAISDFGHYRGGHTNKDIGDFKSIFYLTFHPLVSERIRKGTASANRALYNGVKSGIEKRILSFLEAKEALFGPTYTFEVDELAVVLGFDHQTAYRKRDSIRKHLENLKVETKLFDYTFHKIDGRLNICIEHSSEVLKLEQKFEDEFFSELVYYYGIDDLTKIDFTEEDLSVLRSELKGKFLQSTGSEQFTFHKMEINPIELAVDLALYQVLKCNYQLKRGPRFFAKMLFEKLCTDEASFPNGYKYFVTKRNNDKRREIEAEKIRNALINQKNFEEEENRKFEIGFEKLWNNYSKNQPEIISALMAKAEELYKDDSDISNSLLKSMLIEQKAKDMAKEIYKNGKLTDLVGAVISEQKKLEKAPTQTRSISGHTSMVIDSSPTLSM
jgi:hypothetical protein